MVQGRFRQHDREEIAEKLIEWAQLDDSFNLCAFSAKHFILPSKISQWAKEDEYFRQAYEYARISIGSRREQALKDNKLHVKAYDLNAKTYDLYLKEESREEMAYQARVKAESEKNVIQESQKDIVEGVNKVLDQLDSIRSSSNNTFSKDSNRNNKD